MDEVVVISLCVACYGEKARLSWIDITSDSRDSKAPPFLNMNQADAIKEILEKASRIKLPGQSLDVVTLARCEYIKNGGCNTDLSAQIEHTIKKCVRGWTAKQKQGIWETSVEGLCFYEQTAEWLDEVLKTELLYRIIDSFCQEEEQT